MWLGYLLGAKEMRGFHRPPQWVHTVIFGLNVTPLWVEDGQLRGPMLELLANAKLPRYGSGHPGAVRPPDSDNNIDMIDCSNLDQNIHAMRHSYYMLNTQMVEDICELIGTQRSAEERSRLVRVEGNVYTFLCPPGFLMGNMRIA
jgi:hypothetical protein